MHARIFTDGGSRGNPGPAGAGAVLVALDGTELGAAKRYLGTATNNEAEYESLLMGMDLALANGVTQLDVHMDSELVVRQMNGRYRVRQPHLARRFLQVRDKASRFERVTYTHVRRERNKRADQLVNEAIDEAMSS